MNIFRTVVACIALVLTLSVVRYVWSTQQDIGRTVYQALDSLGMQLPSFTEDKVFTIVKRNIEQRGLDPNFVDRRTGMSLLMYAARTGSLKIVKYLVDKGADVHYQSQIGETPLMYAVLSGSLPILKFLIEDHGADVNQVSFGWSVLKWSKDFGQPKEIVEYLISKGAKPSAYEWGQNRPQPTHF